MKLLVDILTFFLRVYLLVIFFGAIIHHRPQDLVIVGIGLIGLGISEYIGQEKKPKKKKPRTPRLMKRD